MSLENFKAFVKTRPNLASLVNSGSTSWQKLYETFEMYGSDSSVWNNFTNSTVTIKDMINNIKSIDVTEVQNSINSLQKGLNYIGELIKPKDAVNLKNVYEPRPLYRYFDD